MCAETIAARRRLAALRRALRARAGRLLTGPGAFLLAAVIDVGALLWWLARRRRRGHLY